MRRVVLDTNVLVSAALSPGSVPGRVVGAAFERRFELIASTRLIDELSGVLHRPKFAELVTSGQVEAYIEAVEEVATVVDDPEVLELLRDPDDDFLVALATASEADALVSGDNDLLDAGPLPVRVLSPRAFLDELARE